jgi:hypothetical protein
VAAEQSGALRTQNRATLAERNAAEIEAKVSEEGGSPARSADELQSRALDDVAAGHDEVNRAASEVLAAIDAIEAKVARLLQDVRDEVEQIANQGTGAEPEIAQAEPDRPDKHAASADTPGRGRSGLFKRRPRIPRQCDVCGRAPRSSERALERWQQEARMSLCPECQAKGWRLPHGGAVPHRATADTDPS